MKQAILVYAPSWIGDAVLSLGALRVLRAARPEARIVVLTRPWVRELYDGVECIDGVLDYEPHAQDRGVTGFVRAAARVARERFDVSLILPNAFRAAALVLAARIGERWGYATEGRGLLLTRSIPPAPRPFGRHQAHYYLDLMSGLGFDAVSEPDLHLVASERARERAHALLEAEGWDGRPLIGVHPGATNSRAKIWPPLRFAEAARRLAEARDGRVVVLGGPSDRELCERVRSTLGGDCIALDGKTSLGELIGVLERLAIVLTNDSGPMHIAAALGTPTLAVFGPTDPRETGPVGEKAGVVREPVDCSPCLFRDCPIDHRCMDHVFPSRVVAEAEALLA
ncbi:MAG TPA: lipopolysaccharide heptosyltransferase II [Vicinamibacteria bacterium]|nr:lipopolysaccharide heptosyltransferase II [Vicinamibacteria bacterium]